MVVTKRFQAELDGMISEMAWNTGDGYVANTNQVVVSVPAGGTVMFGGGANSFATAGTYTIETTYTSDSTARPVVPGIDVYAVPREKENDVDLIDALFILKPRLKKKYKADRDAFRKDVLAAAEFQQAAVAFDKLDDLLALEI